MFSEILGFLKALSMDIGDLFDVYPKKRKPFTRNPDDRLPEWGPDSYEPWDFLSEEQWKEILEGKKPLEDYTTSHVWPPHLKDDEPIEDKQEEGSDKVDEGIQQEQNDDSRNAESAGNSEDSDDSSEINSAPNPDSEFETDAFESDFDGDYSSGDYGSGNYDGYIG